jgi:hypothetical protein
VDRAGQAIGLDHVRVQLAVTVVLGCALTSGFGTFETCRPAAPMSVRR